MKPLSITIFGYDELLLAAIDFFENSDSKIAAVVFPSNLKDPRAMKVRELVEQKGLVTLEQPPVASNEAFKSSLRKLKPDAIFVWSYPMILSQEIIDIPKNGAVNLHFGLLPEYRGVNGIRWALLNGEPTTGVTLHYMDAGIDTGDIIARVSFPIEPTDDIRSLMIKSRTAGLHVLKQCWPAVETGTVTATPQDDKKAGYYSAAMSPSEILDWSKTSLEIHNLIRASVTPLAGVYSIVNGKKLQMKRSIIVDHTKGEFSPGMVVDVNEIGIVVATSDGSLLVTDVEYDGNTVANHKLVNLGLTSGRVLE